MSSRTTDSRLTNTEIHHGQHAGEDALIVAIEKATETSEGCDTKHLGIGDECLGTSFALESDTTVKRRLVELRGSSWCFVERSEVRVCFELKQKDVV